jgi:hypothetical protein
MNIWTRMDRYFNKKEAWGRPEKMSGLLLMTLYQIRVCSDWKIIIHCGTQGKHCANSYHYKGLAVDFHFIPPPGITLYEQTQNMLAFFSDMQLQDSVGLGVYPEWNNPGFHFDVRGSRARWGKLNDEYVGFTILMDHLKKENL